ncbi:MAG: hypothetical protein ACI31R_04035 [Bacilli bacterium]
MERRDKTKLIAVIALVVAIVGLSVGFAAFSNVLTIKSSATVNPTNTFSVVFSSSNTALETNPVSAVTTGDVQSTTDATISNGSSPTISNLSATFTEPGQKATYTFYAHNNGEYDAYLNSITYANLDGKTTNKVCTKGTNTTDSLVQTACNDIVVKLQAGSEAETTGSVANISGHSLLKTAYEPIVVTIEYLTGGARADGDFTVAFGDITLDYSSAD